ncbi:MAG: hypothetical protein AAFQ63_21190, partial [Cyanobacteria bacterium J06621_11]
QRGSACGVSPYQRRENGVGYYKKFFTDSFANQNMRLFKQSLRDWRAFEIEAPITEFGQDFLVFAK